MSGKVLGSMTLTKKKPIILHLRVFVWVEPTLGTFRSECACGRRGILGLGEENHDRCWIRGRNADGQSFPGILG